MVSQLSDFPPPNRYIVVSPPPPLLLHGGLEGRAAVAWLRCLSYLGFKACRGITAPHDKEGRQAGMGRGTVFYVPFSFLSFSGFLLDEGAFLFSFLRFLFTAT